MRIILGSQSPRRKELFAHLVKDFEIIVKSVEENYPTDCPKHQIAAFLAEKKASAFKQPEFEDALVVTADTTVLLDDRLLEKAASSEEAKAMLEAISGRKHVVISAACLLYQGKMQTVQEETEVHFKNLSEAEIDFYIDNYQPFDKAGAYGIQEWIGMIGIEKIVGSYYNVVGMPMREVYESLRGFGI